MPQHQNFSHETLTRTVKQLQDHQHSHASHKKVLKQIDDSQQRKSRKAKLIPMTVVGIITWIYGDVGSINNEFNVFLYPRIQVMSMSLDMSPTSALSITIPGRNGCDIMGENFQKKGSGVS